MSCQLDHIAIIAPSLKDGALWVRNCLGVMPSMGGAHPEMGTHNMLLRLGDDLFLEVISVDPNAPKPAHARWFGLDQRDGLAEHWAQGRRLRGMIARTDDLDGVVAQQPHVLGAPMRITRGQREWRFAVREDGRLPYDGALPCVMDWGAQGPAAPDMADTGCRLVHLVLETAAPDAIGGLHERLGFAGGPEIRAGSANRLIAVIDTPNGPRLLT